ncbi:MAG: vitamin B12 dependent-methionine synthase activation domain-containing protein, partial [Bacillota bacterium]|nr:vitamin B12 dependent-methionine synthase activation domain-containing protein [Bacillota bacterium]
MKIAKIVISEALRYLGVKEENKELMETIGKCESELLKCAEPRSLFRAFKPEECAHVFLGNDIQKHLEHCEIHILMCATLGSSVDTLIAKKQVSDMSKAVIFDSLASAMVEQVCDECEREIAAAFPEYNMTNRFSPGYGDYPLSVQKEFLTLLDAPRKIGLSVNESYLLTPVKSVTAVIGLSKNSGDKSPITNKKNCKNCNLFG